LIAEALAHTSDATPLGLRSRLEYANASIRAIFDDHDGVVAAGERSLVGLRAVEAPWRVARALFIIGASLPFLGRAPDALVYYAEVLEIAKAHGLRKLHATTLHAIGIQKIWLNDFAGARETISSAIAEFSALGDASRVAISQSALANIEELEHNYDTAIQLAAEALETLRDTAPYSYRGAIIDQANRYILVGRWDEARICAREAVRISIELQVVPAFLRSAQHLSVAIVLDPDSQRPQRVRAARMLGYLSVAFGPDGPEFDKPPFERALEALRTSPDRRDFETAQTEGAALNQDEAFDLANRL
jgi:tetratricopeptide (TPR) repeat protein